jgi:hypothetical protein
VRWPRRMERPSLAVPAIRARVQRVQDVDTVILNAGRVNLLLTRALLPHHKPGLPKSAGTRCTPPARAPFPSPQGSAGFARGRTAAEAPPGLCKIGILAIRFLIRGSFLFEWAMLELHAPRANSRPHPPRAGWGPGAGRVTGCGTNLSRPDDRSIWPPQPQNS